MADRNIQFPQGQGFMMQGTPRFVQPGVPMMQQQRMMMAQGQMRSQGQIMPQGQVRPQGQMVFSGQPQHMGQGMHPMPMMGMRMPPAGPHPSYNQVRAPPSGAPPSYNQARQESFQHRQKSFSSNKGNRNAGKTEEQIQKEKHFQQQQAKLKQFGKPSSSGLDPNKIIDSMFGGHEAPKPRTIKKQQAPVPQTTADDGFGDFLSGPQLQMAQSTTLSTTSLDHVSAGASLPMNQDTASSPPQPILSEDKPKAEKKDLTKMMLESCDLTAPQKARLFHKPALKEINIHHSAMSGQSLHHTSHNARSWDKTEELSSLFIEEAVKDEHSLPKKIPPAKHVSPTSKHPPKPPPWLGDVNLLPPVYKQVQEASTVDGQISTERLYPILMLSGLPKEVMGHCWGVCNKITPGQLTVQELYQLLGLIALAQNNYKIETIDILSRCPQPPVPLLSRPESQQFAQPTQMLHSSQGPAVVPTFTQTTTHTPGPQLSAPGVSVHSMGPPSVPPPVGAASIQGPFLEQPAVLGVPGKQLPPLAINPAQMMSSPATLPVTQLPPAVMPQGMLGNVVTMTAADEDDFADFQAAPPPASQSGSFGSLMSDVKDEGRSSVADQSKYLYSVPIPDDKAIAESLAGQDLKDSTVENFFGSDDSSEATSPDDDYFDGYKSADSKPSDSTSQFSTDQSEGEDFRNFENYLDEFQKKKEQLDKESPLHRPISKFSLQQNTSGTKISPKTDPVQKIPMPLQIPKLASITQKASDEFSDFADFQSAPPAESKPVTLSDPLKSTASASDLIGDEDKYAALRSLDFSSPPTEVQSNIISNTEDAANVSTEESDNWADFQEASTEMAQLENKSETQSETGSERKSAKNSILQLFDKPDATGWAAFDSVSQTSNTGSDQSDLNLAMSVQPDTHVQSLPELNKNIETSPAFDSSAVVATTESDDWANFQGTGDDDFSDFQSSSAPISVPVTPGLVSVKKDGLGTSEILGLFKVKNDPLPQVKSRDDDTEPFERTNMNKTVSESINKMHGIVSVEPQTLTENKPRKQVLLSEEDDFMKPPPMDDLPDDDHEELGSYSRGYDLDHIMQPQLQDKKDMYGGIYGANQQFVMSGHKKDKKETEEEDKSVTIEITKELDGDNDSDSVSSKDNDSFHVKFGLGKDFGEDSQSVSSLDFIVNKRVQNLKDGEAGDTQSLSNSEFGNFENGDTGSGILPESKSLDSLDLRRDDAGMDTGGSQENSDKENKDESPDRDIHTKIDDGLKSFDNTPAPGLPVLGDRYSSIMPDIPGSDKHAYEWQRCLDNSCRMIQDANNVFNSISSSVVCNEVIRSSQGSQYIQGVIEIYKVVCKITLSMSKAGIHSDRLTQLLKDIDIAWNNLGAFLVGGSVMPENKELDFSHGVLLSDDTSSQYKACGVCLLNVEMKSRGPETDNDNANLTYGGRQYHAPCANFWINCVDSTMPALKLPELL